MAKKRKHNLVGEAHREPFIPVAEWTQKDCGCVKTTLPSVGKVLIRCSRHRDKPYKGKRVLCYWDDSGIVQRA